MVSAPALSRGRATCRGPCMLQIHARPFSFSVTGEGDGGFRHDVSSGLRLKQSGDSDDFVYPPKEYC